MAKRVFTLKCNAAQLAVVIDALETRYVKLDDDLSYGLDDAERTRLTTEKAIVLDTLRKAKHERSSVGAKLIDVYVK